MFPETYDQARANFRTLARARRARLESIIIPGIGCDGEPLSIDWAVIGDRSASRALLSISGVHGAEGYAGSAAQCAFLDTLDPAALRGKCSVVLVHALNPWGMSHRFRTDANNIDLSRNFVDFNRPLPPDRGYADIHRHVCPDNWDVGLPERIEALFVSTVARIGAAGALDAFTGGQYDHADGLAYGGHGPAACNSALRAVLELELSDARTVAYLEWHTGFGAYGRPLSVALDPPDSNARRTMDRWWVGLNLQTGDEAFASGKMPDWFGLVLPGVRRILPNADIIGSPIEIGTVSNINAFVAVMIDRWLRFGGPSRASMEAEMLRARMRLAYDPADDVWRSNVLIAGQQIHQASLSGILSS
jgi:hypothetical protein